MKSEINTAVTFLSKMLRNTEPADKQSFERALEAQLLQRYETHWFPENPHIGNAYRCVDCTDRPDPIVRKAAEAVGVMSALPTNITLWVDPGEVHARIGDSGSIFPLEIQSIQTESAAPTISTLADSLSLPSSGRATPRRPSSSCADEIPSAHNTQSFVMPAMA